jgi:hypothetical protein
MREFQTSTTTNDKKDEDFEDSHFESVQGSKYRTKYDR